MKYAIFTILSLTCSVLYYIHSPYYVQHLCDVGTCPVCYGTDLCNVFAENKIKLHYSSIKEYVFNIISVKNVYFALFEGKKVVLKKLAHNSELQKLNDLTVSGNYKETMDFLLSDSGIKRFKICDIDTAELFMLNLNYEDIRNVQAILHTNAEPILLQIFDSQYGWCVPKLYGFCGRLVVVEDAGIPLSFIENFNWLDRAYVAFQILQAAMNFTENHKDFRLYLTDISPDNIAVNEELKISFIDLEDVIIKKKILNGTIHHTEHFNENFYSYSEKQICDNSISDHNIYAVCRLLLSTTALWPMMENGLLHNPPTMILENYNKLFENIEICVHPQNDADRFQLHKVILSELKTIILKFTNYII